MEATRLAEQIEELKKLHPHPISSIEAIRRQLSNPQPAILNEQQRQLFIGRLDYVKGFLESEDGADTIELLVDAFRKYSEAQQCEPETSEKLDDDDE